MAESVAQLTTAVRGRQQCDDGLVLVVVTSDPFGPSRVDFGYAPWPC